MSSVFKNKLFDGIECHFVKHMNGKRSGQHASIFFDINRHEIKMWSSKCIPCFL